MLQCTEPGCPEQFENPATLRQHGLLDHEHPRTFNDLRSEVASARDRAASIQQYTDLLRVQTDRRVGELEAIVQRLERLLAESDRDRSRITQEVGELREMASGIERRTQYVEGRFPKNVQTNIEEGHIHGDPAHSAITLAADADALLAISAAQVLSLDTQVANRIFAGPASGGAADPTFRALVTADLPGNPFNASAYSILTIVSGAVTKTGPLHYIAAESGTTDDLDTMAGGATGE